MLLRIWQSIQSLKRESDQEIDEELDYHIEMLTRKNIESGMTSDDARGTALRRFGDFNRVRKSCIQVRAHYRAERLRKAAKLLAWPLIVYGLVVRHMGISEYVAHSGTLLIVIGLLWRLFLYVRARGSGDYQFKPDSGNALLLADRRDEQAQNGPHILSGEGREQIASIFGYSFPRDEKTMTDDDG